MAFETTRSPSTVGWISRFEDGLGVLRGSGSAEEDEEDDGVERDDGFLEKSLNQ